MKLSRAEFEQVVAEALDELPEEIAEVLANISVFVEQWPSAEILKQMNLRSRFSLLGLYEGIPLTCRDTNYSGVLPDRVTIFQGPIESAGRSRSELRDEIKSVVVHEIAHHFGIDDERIRELGY
jgi:predicted Zn-dependent protease with MMP-like domain